MLNTLIGRITSIVKQEFLFAALLPTLLFWLAILASLAWVIGFGAVASMYEELSRTATTQLSAAAAVALVVSAYVVSAVQPAIVRVWSGESGFVGFWGFRKVGLARHRRCFQRLKKLADVQSEWASVRREFRDGVREAAKSTAPGAPARPEAGRLKRIELLLLARSLRRWMGPDRVRSYLPLLIEPYGRFTAQSLEPVFVAVDSRLSAWDEEVTARGRSATALLDRSYGSQSSIRSTRLGNVIAAYDQYCYKRYNMEAEIFWPRLRFVIDDDYFKLVESQRVLLDFSLTTASLAALYGMLAMLVGPWLYYVPGVWLAAGVVSAVVAWGFVRVGTIAADRHGDLIRSCFDLFRLQLIKALGHPWPKTPAKEQETWDLLSQLIVYGYTLRPDAPYAPEAQAARQPVPQMPRPAANPALAAKITTRKGRT